MDIFLERATPPWEERQPGPWGGVPEEGTVIVGEDSSMGVIVPEALPVGQGVEVEDGDGADPDLVLA